MFAFLIRHDLSGAAGLSLEGLLQTARRHQVHHDLLGGRFLREAHPAQDLK